MPMTSSFFAAFEAQNRGDFDKSIAYYTRAIDEGDHPADALNNLAAIALARGQLDHAVGLLDRALEHAPDSAFLLANRAKAALGAGDTAGALRFLDKAVALAPGDTALAIQYGNLLLQLDRRADAYAAYARAAAADPNCFDAYLNMGGIHFLSGALAEAQACFERALVIAPGARSAMENLSTVKVERGRAARLEGDIEKAELEFRAALDVWPENVNAKLDLANLLSEAGYPEHAVPIYESAMRDRPDHADLLSNLGHALNLLRDYDAAERYCQRAIELDPDREEPHINLGVALHGKGEFDAALGALGKALSINPRSAAAHTSTGNVYFVLGCLDEAEACNLRALEADPGNELAHVNLGVIRMLRGDYERGWPDYAWRWRSLRLQRKVGLGALKPRPPARIEDVVGRRVLATAEQGLGDAIHFVRYVPMLAAAGAHVTMLVQRPLVPLLDRIDGVARTTDGIDRAEPFDYVVSLLDLGRIFWSGSDTVPGRSGYLRADPGRVAAWRKFLGPKKRPLVGLVWSGSVDHPDDAQRSHPFVRFSEFLPDGLDYVSLQKDVRAADRAALAADARVRHFGDRIGDFADTAAICENLDLIVSVDTSVSHLAGALGRPVLIVLPRVPDWRWGMNGSDSIWYASARLVRQSERGVWADVYTRLAAELRALAAGQAPSLTTPNG